MPDMLLLVGCLARDGAPGAIRLYDLDVAAARATLRETAPLANPSFLALSADRRRLYAANETLDGSLVAFAFDPATHRLTASAGQPTHGDFPCHIGFDRTGHLAFVSNFGLGAKMSVAARSFALMPLDGDGYPMPAAGTARHAGSGPALPYQDGPHAHCAVVSPDNRFVLVTDFGTDEVVTYPFDAERRMLGFAAGVCRLPPGSAPRTLAFAPDGVTAYVSLEMSSQLATLAWGRETGTLTLQSVTSTLPQGIAGPNYPAELRLAPDGRHAFVANRGHDSIAVFALDGETRLAACYPTGGSWPRCFDLTTSGSHAVVANQKTGDIRLFTVDAATGTLSGGALIVETAEPAFVGIADL
jgi:6-phosphogluconolactonase